MLFSQGKCSIWLVPRVVSRVARSQLFSKCRLFWTLGVEYAVLQKIALGIHQKPIEILWFGDVFFRWFWYGISWFRSWLPAAGRLQRLSIVFGHVNSWLLKLSNLWFELGGLLGSSCRIVWCVISCGWPSLPPSSSIFICPREGGTSASTWVHVVILILLVSCPKATIGTQKSQLQTGRIVSRQCMVTLSGLSVDRLSSATSLVWPQGQDYTLSPAKDNSDVMSHLPSNLDQHL